MKSVVIFITTVALLLGSIGRTPTEIITEIFRSAGNNENGSESSSQLTEADIQAMNDNKAIIVRSNEGYVSTIVGRYCNKRINVIPGDNSTANEALDSLDRISGLLGLQGETKFFCSDMAFIY